MTETRSPGASRSDDEAPPEEELEALFEAISDGVVVADPTGRIVLVNEAGLGLLGVSRDDVAGATIESLIPRRFRARHREGFARWAATGQMVLGGSTLRLPLLVPAGREVDVEVTLHTVGQGATQRAVAFVRPARDAGSVQSELSHALLELTASDLPVPELLTRAVEMLVRHLGWEIGLVWRRDSSTGAIGLAASWSHEGEETDYEREAEAAATDGRIELVADVWEQPRVRWVDDLVLDPAFVRTEAADRSGLRSGLLFALESEDGVEGVVELVTHEGRGIDLETHEAVQLLAGELGNLLRRRRLIERITAERERLGLALDAAAMGVWTWELASDRVELSEQASSVLGVGGEVSLAEFTERIHPVDRPPVEEKLAEAARSGADFDFLYRTLDETWIKGSGRGLRDVDGSLVAVTAVCFDVTDSVEYASQLQHRVTQATITAGVGRALTSARALGEKLQECAEVVNGEIDAAFTRIWTLAPGSATLQLEASAGMYTHLDGGHARVPVGEFKIGRIAERRRPHLTNQVVGDPEVSDQEWAEREGMVAFAGYPLIVSDRCVGVLALFATSELSDATLEHLEAISDMIALAVEEDRANAALLDAYHRARQESEARARVAAALQQSLLPPELPDIDGVDLGSVYVAATDDVGGDFYDLFPLTGGTWGLVMGDVCGKGTQAAALTALARHSIRTAAMIEGGPDRALSALNEAMAVPDGGRCTAVMGEFHIDPAAGVRLSLGRAGHPPPLVRRRDGRVEVIDAGGPMIGVFPSATFAVDLVDVDLAPGDALVLYTDGITEARAGRELYGEERLVDLVRGSNATSAQQLADEIVADTTAFGDEQQSDDTAVLVLRVD